MRKTVKTYEMVSHCPIFLLAFVALFLMPGSTAFAEDSIDAIEFVLSGEVGDEAVFSNLLSELTETQDWFVHHEYYDDENDEDVSTTDQLPAGTRITFRIRIPFGSPNLAPSDVSYAQYLGGSLFVTVEGTEIQEWQATGGYGVDVGSRHVYVIEGSQHFGGGTLFMNFEEDIQHTISPTIQPLANPNANILELLALDFDPPRFENIPIGQTVCEYSLITSFYQLLINPTFSQNVIYSDPEFEIGDVNNDCAVNLLDVEPFIDRVSSGAYQQEADVNQDGVVNLLDVEPFIDLISG